MKYWVLILAAALATFVPSPARAEAVKSLTVTVYNHGQALVNEVRSMDLPRGVVRAYQESLDGSTLFIGEDRLDHTPRDAEVELRMGEAFDLGVERRMISREQTGKNTLTYTWEIKIRNSKDEVQRVLVEEAVHGDWRITASSHPHEKVDARRVRFTLDVPRPAGRISLS